MFSSAVQTDLEGAVLDLVNGDDGEESTRPIRLPRSFFDIRRNLRLIRARIDGWTGLNFGIWTEMAVREGMANDLDVSNDLGMGNDLE